MNSNFPNNELCSEEFCCRILRGDENAWAEVARSAAGSNGSQPD